MSLKLETSNGWTEAVINDNCEFEYFYRVVNILKTAFNAKFDKKLDDFDSIYWDFEYEKHQLTLYYNVFLGVSIYPKAFKEATKEDNQKVIQISTKLFEEINKP